MIQKNLRFRTDYPPEWLGEEPIYCKRCGILTLGSVAIGIKTARGKRIMVLVALCSLCVAQVSYERLRRVQNER